MAMGEGLYVCGKGKEVNQNEVGGGFGKVMS